MALGALTLATSACAAPAAPPPEQPVVAAPLAELPPLLHRCRDALPLSVRTIGALHRLLRRVAPRLRVEQRDCHAGDAWPIAYATSESAESGRPPMGFEVLRMTGDALLLFDSKDREAPTVNLCRILDYTLDGGQRVRAVALWESGDDGAFDARHPERATATLAWLELLSRDPSFCALGEPEADDDTGVPSLREEVRCALEPTPLRAAAGCAPGASAPPGAAADPGPDGVTVDKTLARTHRFSGLGRATAADPPGLELRLEQPERCVYEPPPAARDVCLAVYTTPSGERWYGRGDVTRTGEAGHKNYVDSYLTFVLLKRIEAERKGTGGRAAAPAPSPPSEPPPGPSKK